LLAGKLIVVLCHPSFGINLLGAGSRLSILLVSLLLYEEELHSWLRRRGPHHDHWNGLENQSAIRCWHICDGVSRGHHVTPSGAGGSRAPLGMCGGVVLIENLLKAGVQRWHPVMYHSYEYGA
jgi:hypothetical protein